MRTLFTQIQLETLAKFLLLGFCVLYLEAPFVARLLDPQTIYIPIWDLEIDLGPGLFAVLELIFCSSVLLCAVPRLVIPMSLIALVANLALASFDTFGRQQFHVMAGFLCLTFALVRLMDRSESTRYRRDLPFVILVATVYGFAAFHKGLFFEETKLVFADLIFSPSSSRLAPICRESSCWFMQFLTWSVVPVEVAMAALTLFRKATRARLILIFAFHTLVAMTAELLPASVVMLTCHLYLCSLQNPEVARTVFTNRKWKPFFILEALFISGIFLGPWPIEWIPFMKRIFVVSSVIAPYAFLLWPFVISTVRHSRSSVARCFWPFQKDLRALTLSSFALFLIAFGFSPLLTTPVYSIVPIGWTMFSGGRRIAPKYTLWTPNKPCYDIKTFNTIFKRREQDNQFVYFSSRWQTLKALKKGFEEKRNCDTDPANEQIGELSIRGPFWPRASERTAEPSQTQL